MWGSSFPITTVCPCSKEISQFGAHNQRSIVTVHLRFKKFIWIEDIIQLIEECASCDLYSILKRPDEKFVTEKAYENPMFVEDVVREIAKTLKKGPEYHLVYGRVRKLRIDPQPQCLCLCGKRSPKRNESSTSNNYNPCSQSQCKPPKS